MRVQDNGKAIISSATQEATTMPPDKRIEEEKKVVELMIRLYCRKKEGHATLCPECTFLLQYARHRLDHCHYNRPPKGGQGKLSTHGCKPSGHGCEPQKAQESKPTCKKCPIHCYRSDMKERIRVVMRWAGPRMMFYHPMAAAKHLLREMF